MHKEGAYLNSTEHTRHSALGFEARSAGASRGGDGAGLAFGLQLVKGTEGQFEPQRGKMKNGSGWLGQRLYR